MQRPAHNLGTRTSHQTCSSFITLHGLKIFSTFRLGFFQSPFAFLSASFLPPFCLLSVFQPTFAFLSGFSLPPFSLSASFWASFHSPAHNLGTRSSQLVDELAPLLSLFYFFKKKSRLVLFILVNSCSFFFILVHF